MGLSSEDFHLLKDYHVRAMATAAYPNKGNNLVYPVLGLLDEIGEVVEKLINFDHTQEFFDLILSEFGDVLWYFNSVIWEARQTAEQQQYITYPFVSFIDMTQCNILPMHHHLSDTLILKRLIVSVSKLQGIVKKALRDNDGKIQKHKFPKLFENIVLSLTEYQKWIRWINLQYSSYLKQPLTICSIATENINKLEDRKQRDVIKGDGDKR